MRLRLGLAVALVATSLGGAQELPVLDAYLCWRVKPARGRSRFGGATITLADRFETSTVAATRPRQLCLPADVDGAGVVDSDTALAGFRLQPPAGPARVARRERIRVTNALGEQLLDADDAPLFLDPAYVDAEDGFAPPCTSRSQAPPGPRCAS